MIENRSRYENSHISIGLPQRMMKGFEQGAVELREDKGLLYDGARIFRLSEDPSPI